MRDRDTFELRIEHDNYRDGSILDVRSYRYDVRLGYRLRGMWGDPRRLADYIDLLVGGTLHAWASAGVETGIGREMAHALAPHWERQIHRFMERMEYEDRHRAAPYRGMRHDAMYFDDFGPAPWGKPEDPKAKEKARQLLMRQLDDGQEKSFKKDGEFRVTAKDGKVYTIKTARSFNVVGPDGTKYCGQLADTPIEDQMLAQKLLLEHEPDKFFKNANVSPAPGALPRPEDQMVNIGPWIAVDPARWMA